jgi:hypothetical protein
MLCGRSVKKHGTKGAFDLTAPKRIAATERNDSGQEDFFAAQQSFAPESGALTVSLHLGAVHDPGK